MSSPRPARSSAPTDLALVAVFAALIAALAVIPMFHLGPIPITLQPLAVALAGLCLGPVRGFLSVCLYIVVGLAGVPIFAGFTGGFAVFSKASAGYLVSFPFAAALTGLISYWAVRRFGPNPVWLFLAAVVSRFVVILPFGVVGMMQVLHISATKAFWADVAFWGIDAGKYAVAALVAAAVHRAFPALAGRRTRPAAEPAAPKTVSA